MEDFKDFVDFDYLLEEHGYLYESLYMFIRFNPIETVLDVEDEHKAPIKVATFMVESGGYDEHVLVI